MGERQHQACAERAGCAVKEIFKLIEDEEIKRAVTAGLTLPFKISTLAIEMMMLGMSKDYALEHFSMLWDQMDAGRKVIEEKIRGETEAKSNAGE